MHLLIQYLLAQRIVDEMTPEQRENARNVLLPMAVGQVVRGALPGAHPIVSAAVSQIVTERLKGQAGILTDDDLIRHAGKYAARTWADAAFPDLSSEARGQVAAAVVRARGW